MQVMRVYDAPETPTTPSSYCAMVDVGGAVPGAVAAAAAVVERIASPLRSSAIEHTVTLGGRSATEDHTPSGERTSIVSSNENATASSPAVPTRERFANKYWTGGTSLTTRTCFSRRLMYSLMGSSTWPALLGATADDGAATAICTSWRLRFLFRLL
eukprot:Amastigsp_a2072_14.p3 type:complete len:157 gc:universal Amastigsp_a2072_14:571-101(-)